MPGYPEIEKVYPEVEKVRILLAEHATLRAEIIARIGHAYQLMTVGTGSLAFLGGAYAPTESYKFWLILFGVLGFLGLGFWTFTRDMRKCAKRIREIELDVNERAHEDLLVWENQWGGEINGYFGRSHPKPRSYLQKLGRPLRTFRGELITV